MYVLTPKRIDDSVYFWFTMKLAAVNLWFTLFIYFIFVLFSSGLKRTRFIQCYRFEKCKVTYLFIAVIAITSSKSVDIQVHKNIILNFKRIFSITNIYSSTILLFWTVTCKLAILNIWYFSLSSTTNFILIFK